jgi:hypothetical protein
MVKSLSLIRTERKRLRVVTDQGAALITETWMVYPSKISEASLKHYVNQNAINANGMWQLEVPGMDLVVGVDRKEMLTTLKRYLTSEGVEVN